MRIKKPILGKILFVAFILSFVSVWAGVRYFQTPPPITKTAEITLNVKPAPDFILSTNMTHIETFINRTIAFAITVESVNEFTGDISFEVTGFPTDWVITYFPAQSLTLGPDQPKGISVEIIIPDDGTIVGAYTMTVTATTDNYN